MATTSYLTVNGEILSETRGGVESDYVPDPLGSTAALIGSSQTITDTFNWWPFGELRSHPLGSSLTPFGYVGTLGYYTDVISGRLYVRAATYRPALTRWQAVDPRWPSELSFAYANGNPQTHADPSGMSVTDWIGCALCALPLYRAWGGDAPQHICRPGYAHCMTCCALTANYGGGCALAAQGAQGSIHGRDLTTRLAQCAVGISAAGSLGGGDIVQGCDAACAKAFPMVGPYNIKCTESIKGAAAQPYPPMPFPCAGGSSSATQPEDPVNPLPCPNVAGTPAIVGRGRSTMQG